MKVLGVLYQSGRVGTTLNSWSYIRHIFFSPKPSFTRYNAVNLVPITLLSIVCSTVCSHGLTLRRSFNVVSCHTLSYLVIPSYTMSCQHSRRSQVLELRPKVDWNKGSAVNWILDALDLGHRSDVFPIYLGDDITDEDAFVAMETRCKSHELVSRASLSCKLPCLVALPCLALSNSRETRNRFAPTPSSDMDMDLDSQTLDLVPASTQSIVSAKKTLPSNVFWLCCADFERVTRVTPTPTQHNTGPAEAWAFW